MAADSGAIVLLHLSDLHCSSGKSWDHEVVFSALLADVSSQQAEHQLVFDLVVVTGDISFSAQRSQFSIASEYLTRLAAATGTPVDRFIVVPGNHDVDRTLAGRVPRYEIRDEADVNALLSSTHELSSLSRKFGNFRRFLKSFAGQVNHEFSYAHPFFVRSLEIGGHRLGVAALNTALLSREDSEYGRLALGERQVRGALKELDDSGPQDLRLAVLHHSPSYLATFDSEVVLPLLMQGFDLVLMGHEHSHSYMRMESPDAGVPFLTAGSEFHNRRHRNSYNLISLLPTTRQGRVLVRRWSNEGGGCWVADADRYRAQDSSGAYTFTLSRAKPAGASSPVSNASENLAVNSALQALRPLLIQEQANLARDVGYVPLEFSLGADSGRGKRLDLEPYLDSWLTAPGSPSILLLGEYGMGKSRFLRHYVSMLARRFLEDPGRARVPFLIVLKKHRFASSLGDVLTLALAENYGIHVPYAETKRLTECGRAVILVDGFDELEATAGRASLARGLDELKQWAQAPNKIIVAGRSGYVWTQGDSGRELPRDGTLRAWYDASRDWDGSSTDQSAITTLCIQQLGDHQLELFVAGYPSASDEKRSLVMDLLRNDSTISKLARRPVILKLLLDCDQDTIKSAKFRKVSQFYRLITDNWLANELDRQVIAVQAARTEIASAALRVIESVASYTLSTGESEVDQANLRAMATTVCRCSPLTSTPEFLADFVQSYSLFEHPRPTAVGFAHRSFAEFHVARGIVRTIDEGGVPEVSDRLPSIEILDFVREQFGIETARKSIHILDKSEPSPNLKVVLLIALRQYPELVRERLEDCLTRDGESFGVRRVAAFSLVNTEPDAIMPLVRLLETSRAAQYENLAFLSDLWKADAAEIARRTRLRLEHPDNLERPYWRRGKAVHILTLAQVGNEEDLQLLRRFAEDPDPLTARCALSAVESITDRYSLAARALDERLGLAVCAAREAGRLLGTRFGRPNRVVRMDPHDITTQADIDAQAVIVGMIKRDFPEDGVVAEEGPMVDPGRDAAAFKWVIDPLDGSVNFYSGLDRFAVAIALLSGGVPVASVVYAPLRGETYWFRTKRGAFLNDRPISVSVPPEDGRLVVAYASSRHTGPHLSDFCGEFFRAATADMRAVRLQGCASLDFCDLASGHYDALIRLPGPDWDVLPGVSIAQGADAVVALHSLRCRKGLAVTVAGSSPTTVKRLTGFLDSMPVES